VADQEDNDPVRSRYLAIGAAIWTAGYAALYIAIVSRQGNPLAWWYLALLVVGAGSLAVAATGLVPRTIVILGAVFLALAALAGALSIGMLLVPAVAAAAVAAIRPPPRPGPGDGRRIAG
jgi:hypothetical protein